MRRHSHIDDTARQSAPLKTGRHARFIYLYLPELALRRIARQHQLDDAAPLAIYASYKGGDRLRYCNAAARSFGLVPDMTLSDARALCALCRFYPDDEEADRQWLVLIARWCWRYSPVVGCDEDRLGLWIDCTGADHLWGGAEGLCADLATHCAEQGLVAHIVMASYYGAALGLAITCLPDKPLIIAQTDKAHHDALSSLPVTALRLSADQSAELAMIGISSIGDLSQLKRGMISMRFSEDILLRRDQIYGHIPERPVPLPHVKPVMVQQHYHEPIGGLPALEIMVTELITGLAALLQDMQLGCRHVQINWQTIDGNIGQVSHKLSRPSRDVRLLLRLFQEAAAGIDAGFGIEYSWITAGALSAQMPQPLVFGDDGKISEDNSDSLSQLVDHLAARLGSDVVQKLTMVENWIPEESEYFTPAQMITDPPHNIGSLSISSEAGYAPRPMRLLSPPEPIQAIALLPDHPPSQIRWRGRNLRIRRATGPERIGPKWWQITTQDETISRDYYRLETDDGYRLWVYRFGLPERGDAISWYLHGLFA